MASIRIIGTSHIAQESVEAISAAFDEINPEIVCLELDRRRMFALMNNVKSKPRLADARKIGIGGYLFLSLGGWLQQKLGDQVGMTPGSEMKSAIAISREREIKIALIDQDMELTLKSFSKNFTLREKMKLVSDLILAPFGKKEKIDISKVPEKTLIKRLLNETKIRYPGLYKALVEERNIVMAENISKIAEKNPESRILVIIGAGHEDEVKRILTEKNLQIL